LASETFLFSHALKGHCEVHGQRNGEREALR